ncbi:MAG: hypothetical protein ACRDX9_04020 [Acidimicrobiia bacterium]
MAAKILKELEAGLRSFPRGIQVLLAAAIAIFMGFFGLIFLFSDSAYGSLETAMWYAIHFFLPGFAIGLFLPRAWYVSVLVAWFPILAALGYGCAALLRSTF